MNRQQRTEQEQSPEIIREERLVRYYCQRIKGKIIISVIGLFSLLLVCLYHLIFQTDDFSGKIPASRELTKKQTIFLENELDTPNKRKQ